jgi:hypothetical protein
MGLPQYQPNYLFFSADLIHASRIFRFSLKGGASKFETKDGVDDLDGSDPRLKTWHSGIYYQTFIQRLLGTSNILSHTSSRGLACDLNDLTLLSKISGRGCWISSCGQPSVCRNLYDQKLVLYRR